MSFQGHKEFRNPKIFLLKGKRECDEKRNGKEGKGGFRMIYEWKILCYSE